jgi:hypothetical protein
MGSVFCGMYRFFFFFLNDGPFKKIISFILNSWKIEILD